VVVPVFEVRLMDMLVLMSIAIVRVLVHHVVVGMAGVGMGMGVPVVGVLMPMGLFVLVLFAHAMPSFCGWWWAA
jgi:hypothetical protein